MKVSIDTRTLEPGDLYIPVKGEHFDGHDFIEEALQKGASKIIDEPIQDYAAKYRKRLKGTVIAIVGSYGKTTVKDMLNTVLSQSYKVTATLENQNNEIGVSLTILKANIDDDFVLVECGLRKANDLAVLSRILRPNQVIFTGVGMSHMAFFKSQRALSSAKSKIFQKACVWESPLRKTYINFQSPFYQAISQRAEKYQYRVLPYQGFTGAEQNMQVVQMIGQEAGISLNDIQRSLAGFQGSSHRMKKYQCAGVTLIDDTYNANPDGMAYALNHLKSLKGRKIAVLADMLELGRFSDQSHDQLLDLMIDSQLDIVFCIGDAFSKLQSDQIDLMHFQNKEAMIPSICMELKSGDQVLFKGSRFFQLETVFEAVKESLI